MIIVQRYAHFLATGLHIWPPSLSRDGRERGGRGQMEVCKVRGLARIISHVVSSRMTRGHVTYDTDSRIKCYEPSVTISNGVEQVRDVRKYAGCQAVWP